MQYLPLIWSNLWRKKTRTIFTLLSIVIAFLLFGVLETVDQAFSNPSTGVSGVDKLITTNKYSITLSLPFSQVQQVRSVPGIAAVTWMTWVGAYYQDEKNFVFALPVDTQSYFDVHKDEFIVDQSQMRAFENNRSGALVNVALLKQFGWKVGDKLPLHSTIWAKKSDGSLNWTFDIVGTFDVKDATQASAQRYTTLFHYEMFDEGRSFGNGTIGWMEERVADPAQLPELAKRIDAMFANSSNETKTQPANEFATSFMKQLGDIGFVVRMILAAVFFALLFLTGNTTMQAVRDRIPEFAVLKTVGFSNERVLGLVLAEALVLCLVPAIVGLGLSFALLPVIKKGLNGVELAGWSLVPGLGVAVLLGVVIGLPPALRAMRLSIVDALANRR